MVRPDRLIGPDEFSNERRERERQARRDANRLTEKQASRILGEYFQALLGDESRIAPGKTSRVPAAPDPMWDMLHPDQGITKEEYDKQQFMERQRQLTGPLETMPTRPLTLDRFGFAQPNALTTARAGAFPELDVSYTPADDTLVGGTGNNTLAGGNKSKGGKARSVVDVIMGEAGGKTPQERLTEMLGVASVIDNRAKQLGITPEEVVAQDGQFNAFGKSIPKGTEKYRDLAQQALDYVTKNGPVTTATFFSASGTKAPKGASQVAQVGPATTFYDGTLGAPKGRGLQDVADVTANPGNWSTVGNFKPGVDPRLSDILSTAASEVPGYHVEAFSGYRAGDPRQHGKGRAIDVRLVDDVTGQPLNNYQDPSTFRAYESFAQKAREVQQEKYPELDKDFRWGGYFAGKPGQYGAVDEMHFDLGGLSGLGMAGGSWETGLTDQQRSLFPGVESVGMMQPDVPTPAARPQFASVPENVGNAVPASLQVAATANRVPTLDSLNPISTAQASPTYSGAQTAPALGGAPVAASAAQSVPSLNASDALSALAGEPVKPSSPTETVSGMDAFANPLDQGISDWSMGGATPPVADRLPNMETSFGILGPISDRPPPIDPNYKAPPPQLVSPISPVPTDEPQSQVVNPVLAQRTITPRTEDIFPPAPPQPSNWQKVKAVAAPVLDDALTGFKFGGIPGALAGGVMGAMPSLGLNFADLPNGFVPEKDRFSVGFGLPGIEAAMNGGQYGATGFSNSLPGAFDVNRGMPGYFDLYNPLGGITTYSNDHIVGNSHTLSRMMGMLGLGGGKDISPAAQRDIDRGVPGLY